WSDPVSSKAECRTESPSSHQNREWIDGRSLPPALFGTERKNREVQVRRAGRGVACGSNIADHLTAFDSHSFMDAWGIAVQVRVVVAILLRGVELVESDSPLLAQEQFLHDAIIGCNDRRSSRRHNIGRFVLAAGSARLVECVVDVHG